MSWYVTQKLTKRGRLQQDSRWGVVFSLLHHPQRSYVWNLFVFLVPNAAQIIAWFLQIAMPLAIVSEANAALNYADLILCVMFLLFLAIETKADGEMNVF